VEKEKNIHPNLMKGTNPIPTPEVHGVVAKEWGHRFGMDRFSHVTCEIYSNDPPVGGSKWNHCHLPSSKKSSIRKTGGLIREIGTPTSGN